MGHYLDPQALDRATAAEERATAAELAKIELTMALAAAAESRSNVDVDSHAARTPRASDDIAALPGAYDANGQLHYSMSSIAGNKFIICSAGNGMNDKEMHGRNPSLDKGGWGTDGLDSLQSPEDQPGGLQQQLAQLTRTAEEAELAAAVQTRRAAAAEKEVALLKDQLAEAQRQVKELGWQIQMAFGPQTMGGGGNRGAGAGGQAAGWFGDMLGCGANFTRK